MKKPTAESINSDVFGGMDFFGKAIDFYAQAVVPAEKLAKLKADLKEAVDAKKSASLADLAGEVEAAAKDLEKAGKKLSAEAKELVKKGNGEVTKGVVKWGALAGALALAAKEGGADVAMAAAIPVAKQAVQDLPKIKKMNDAVSKLSKLK